MWRILGLSIGATTVFLLTVHLPVAPAQEAGNDQAVLKTIETAWRNRLKKAGSARIKYKWHAKARKLAFLAYNDRGEPVEMPDSERERLAREYFEMTQSGTISIDGLRILYTRKGAHPPDSKGEKLRQIDNRDASDGKTSRSLNRGMGEYPTGDIYGTGVLPAMRDSAQMKPLFWTYIPFKTKLSELDLQNCVVASTSQPLDGRDCIVLQRRQGKTIKSYWVDPGRGYSIVRRTRERRGQVWIQQDCNFERHVMGVWLPKRWTTTFFAGPDHPPKSVGTIEVVRQEVNPEFAENEFTVTFPPGTIVHDHRDQVAKNLGMRPGWALWLVREDGAKRYITWDERNVPYDRIVETPSGMGHLTDEEIAARTGGFPWLWTGWGTVLALLVGATGWVVYRGRRRKKQESAREQA